MALAEGELAAIEDRPASPEDAETCRLIALSYISLPVQDHEAFVVWRTRALVRFAEVGWTEGIGAIAMGEAFRLLARANDDYPNGQTLDRVAPCPAAVAALDALRPLAVEPGSGIMLGPSSPSPSLIARFIWEKRGALLLIARDFDSAAASYARAAQLVEDSTRGPIKVALGRALVDYVRAVENGEPIATAFETTEVLAEQAVSTGQTDLAATAASNLSVMPDRGLSVRLYEIL